jgi:hypothetical protein
MTVSLVTSVKINAVNVWTKKHVIKSQEPVLTNVQPDIREHNASLVITNDISTIALKNAQWQKTKIS